jgi:hypothetical protein
MSAPVRHTFPGALGALRWLRSHGFEMGENLSAAWLSPDGRKAYIGDQLKGTWVAVYDSADAATHEPTACERTTAYGRYSYKNWSLQYACPVCKRDGWFNKNFLGRRRVLCDGYKFHKV